MKTLDEKVLVVFPDGEEFEAMAQFNRAHFNIRDPNASLDKRWRIVISLPKIQKEQVPIGSRLFVSTDVRNTVLSGNEADSGSQPCE